LRQASRRSWRIGQRSNVVVRFLTYNETMQTSCLRLMGKKLLVSLAMEGKFSNEGLQGIEDDDDVLTAMARELVTQRGVGESASAVWKAVQEQHARIQVRTSGTDDDNGASIGDPESASDVDPAISIPSARPTLIFGASPSTAPARRRPKPEAESQLALF
jgi:hypothetical protein